MKKNFFLILSLLIFKSLPTWGDTVYLTPREALKLHFNQSKEITLEKQNISPTQKSSIEKKIGQPLLKNTYAFFVAKGDKGIDGYALQDNEIGKTEPITFMTFIDPEGKITSVEILVYRETHGGEVKEKAFLKQYNNKQITDPLRIGQDIRNVSGATLSSRAITLGVKRALLLWNEFYGK